MARLWKKPRGFSAWEKKKERKEGTYIILSGVYGCLVGTFALVAQLSHQNVKEVEIAEEEAVLSETVQQLQTPPRG
jgi:hypothetical protein